jgi:hypothetical protein
MVRTRSGRTTAVAPPAKRATKSASSDEEDPYFEFSDYQDVPVPKRNTFHGQLRLIAGISPPMTKPPQRRVWKSVLLTTQAHFDRLVNAVNSSTYSKTSGKGGAPIVVPLKKAKPRWGKQAVLVVVSQSPFVRHQLSIERRGPGRYMALAKLVEKRMLAAPSGLGSFDACIFDLDRSEFTADPLAPPSVSMQLQGKGDYLTTPCEPLPSGPLWA